jgi:hypothetical protein
VTSSYYADYDEPEEVREDGSEAVSEVPCPAHCNGGLVEVHGQETDCITCEGYGTIEI